jgi:hypothetical protein
MDVLNKILNDRHRNNSCSLEEINNFITSTNWDLSKDYQKFLLWSNGGEGYIGSNYISLWKLENIIQLNKDYQIQKYLGDNCIAFGTDGGGICYGFDYSLQKKIFKSSLGDLDRNEKIFIANTFDEFIAIALEKDMSD